MDDLSKDIALSKVTRMTELPQMKVQPVDKILYRKIVI